jgi:hypothetical protein
LITPKGKYDAKILSITPGPYDALSISLDYDDDPQKLFPVFLFVPIMDQPEHWHIQLNREQAVKLRDWLNDYMKMTE